MNEPVSLSISHRLGKAEAKARVKNGFGAMRNHLGALITIDQEEWSEDTVRFGMRGLGQSATGTITVLEDSLRIEVSLPWLLARFSERLIPALRKEATALLEKK